MKHLLQYSLLLKCRKKKQTKKQRNICLTKYYNCVSYYNYLKTILLFSDCQCSQLWLPVKNDTQIKENNYFFSAGVYSSSRLFHSFRQSQSIVEGGQNGLLKVNQLTICRQKNMANEHRQCMFILTLLNYGQSECN